MTEKDLEDEKEKEVDNLLEFAYELDYEKFMDDFEVRQAIALIKDRVTEIKKDEDWKNTIAKEWNEASAEEAQGNGYRQVPQHKTHRDDDNKSVISYKSAKTGMSKQSFRSQVLESIKEEGGNKDWDPSVKSETQKRNAEDRVATRLANEVLRDNAKLRGVHSGASLKKLLEKEARRQLNEGNDYKGPVVSVVKDHLKQDQPNASNLPYLHKNPAI